MALSGILWTSTSGLQAVQQQLQWRTDNISNAQSPSYARRDAVTSSTGVNSVVVDVNRATDNGLQDQFLASNSQSSFSATQLGYFQSIGDVLGTSQSTPYIQQAVDSFTSAWKSFETNTSDSSAEAQVISTGQALGDTISQASAKLDQVESTIREDVGQSVSDLNSKLTQLDQINKQLSAEPLASQVNPSLLDTRDSLVRDITGIVGVVRIVHKDNSVALYTNGGVALIDHGANQFYWNNTVGQSPAICLTTSNGSPDLTHPLNNEFTGGKIGAGISTLDNSAASISSSDPKVGTIAKARAQIDNLAIQLAGQEPGTFGGSYYSATADRVSDLTGGTLTNGLATAVAWSPGPPATGTTGNPLYWGGAYDPTLNTNTGGYSTIVTPILGQPNAVVVAPPLNNNIYPLPAAGPYQPPATYNGTPLYDPTKPGQGTFFVIDNGIPPNAPASPSGSFRINPDLVNGIATVKRQSATLAIAALTDNSRSMTAGAIKTADQTYSGLASAIANYQSASQATASNDNTRYNQTTQTFDTRLNSSVGVNMDTEMAQLTVLQNAYAANARVISTVQSMFDTLLSIGK